MNSLLNLTLARSRFAPREQLTAMQEHRRLERVDAYNALLIVFLGMMTAASAGIILWSIARHFR